MNNKGVTLIELLIVIVIIGIISAFAVPAVGRYLTNAQKSAVLQDAVAVRNAASEYCAESGGCTDGQDVEWSVISDRVSNFNDADYAHTVSGNTETGAVAEYTLATDSWTINLNSSATAGGGEWEYISATDPIDADVDAVTAN